MSKWKEVVGMVAPGLATALGGPLAGGAVKILADKLLGGSSGDAVQDEAKLAGLLTGGITPEIKLKLVEAENALKLETQKIDADLQKAFLGDRQDARASNTAIAINEHAPWYVKARQPLLALFAVLGFLACLGALMYLSTQGKPLDPGVKDILVYALGCLTTIVIMVYSYDFGTSSGSQNKDRLAAELLKR